MKRILDVKLTGLELQALGDRLAGLHVEAERLETEKAEVLAEHRREMKVLREEAKTIATQIQSRHAQREVDCYSRPDYALKEMLTIRCDTEAVFERRPLTNDELQPSLPLVDSPVTDAPPRAPANERANAPTNEPTDEETREHGFTIRYGGDEPANVGTHEPTNERAFGEPPRTLLRSPARTNGRAKARKEEGGLTDDEIERAREEIESLQGDEEGAGLLG